MLRRVMPTTLNCRGQVCDWLATVHHARPVRSVAFDRCIPSDQPARVVADNLIVHSLVSRPADAGEPKLSWRKPRRLSAGEEKDVGFQWEIHLIVPGFTLTPEQASIFCLLV